MQRLGIIHPSNSPRASPLHMVLKKMSSEWLSCTQCCHETLTLSNPIFAKFLGIFLRKDNFLQTEFSKCLAYNPSSSGGCSLDHGDHTSWASRIRTYAFRAAQHVTDVPEINEWYTKGIRFCVRLPGCHPHCKLQHKLIHVPPDSVFERLNDFGVIYNLENCVLGVSRVEFLGIKVNAQSTSSVLGKV